MRIRRVAWALQSTQSERVTQYRLDDGVITGEGRTPLQPRRAASDVHPGTAPESWALPLRGDVTAMMNVVRSFIREENGEDLIEYGLLAAFVAALATALLLSNGTLKTAITNAFGKAVTALNAQ